MYQSLVVSPSWVIGPVRFRPFARVFLGRPRARVESASRSDAFRVCFAFETRENANRDFYENHSLLEPRIRQTRSNSDLFADFQRLYDSGCPWGNSSKRPSGTIATHRVADSLREERAQNGRKESRLFPSFFRHISSSVAHGTRGARLCLTVSMSGGPYGGSSSLAAFIRVGAVTVGLTYGVVMNTFTGLFSPSKK